MNNLLADLEPLTTFREEVYDLLGRRRDAQFALLDALLSQPGAWPLCSRSLAWPGQHGYGSLYAALQHGTLDEERLFALWLTTRTYERPWYALDTTPYPRPEAGTSAERAYHHHASRHHRGHPFVPGYASSVLVNTGGVASSWVEPVHVQRLATTQTATELAVE